MDESRAYRLPHPWRARSAPLAAVRENARRDADDPRLLRFQMLQGIVAEHDRLTVDRNFRQIVEPGEFLSHLVVHPQG